MWGFDVLIRHLCSAHREEWLALDKLGGFFITPPGTQHWGGDLAMKKLHSHWLLHPPIWINEKASLQRASLVMRISMISLIALFVLAAIIITVMVAGES
jgi:hypothetical protein